MTDVVRTGPRRLSFDNPEPRGSNERDPASSLRRRWWTGVDGPRVLDGGDTWDPAAATTGVGHHCRWSWPSCPCSSPRGRTGDERGGPDCGTISSTWVARALGPKTVWFAGGRGRWLADLLCVMASDAELAGRVLLFPCSCLPTGSVRDHQHPGCCSWAWGWHPTSSWPLPLAATGSMVALARTQVVLIVVEDDPCWPSSPCRLLEGGARTRTGWDTCSVVVVGSIRSRSARSTPSWKACSYGVHLLGLGDDRLCSNQEDRRIPRGIPGTAGVLFDGHPAVTYPRSTVSVQSDAADRHPWHRPRQPAHQNRRPVRFSDRPSSSSGLGQLHEQAADPDGARPRPCDRPDPPSSPTLGPTLSMSFQKALPESFAGCTRVPVADGVDRGVSAGLGLVFDVADQFGRRTATPSVTR